MAKKRVYHKVDDKQLLFRGKSAHDLTAPDNDDDLLDWSRGLVCVGLVQQLTALSLCLSATACHSWVRVGFT